MAPVAETQLVRIGPMRFRPCIDLHDGRVKQIVGGTLRDGTEPSTNYISEHSAGYYARMYQRDNLPGGHVIMLGGGNEEAAREALSAAPDFLQVGGGITAENARKWLDAGASKVIVTSYLFPGDELDEGRLAALHRAVPRERLVIDLSCLQDGSGRYVVATHRWATLTRTAVTPELFRRLDEVCGEYLIHGVSVEGLQGGPDLRLVELLSEACRWGECTYAGGIGSLEDISAVGRLGKGRIDFTVGSALDIFGGTLLKYSDLKNHEFVRKL